MCCIHYNMLVFKLNKVQVGAFPVASVSACAKEIVNGVCRKQRYVTEPSWFKVTYLWKVFCPELIEWGCRLLFMTTSEENALNKKILDNTGVRGVLYPEPIRTLWNQFRVARVIWVMIHKKSDAMSITYRYLTLHKKKSISQLLWMNFRCVLC